MKYTVVRLRAPDGPGRRIRMLSMFIRTSDGSVVNVINEGDDGVAAIARTGYLPEEYAMGPILNVSLESFYVWMTK